jgi:hypothetical protein
MPLRFFVTIAFTLLPLTAFGEAPRSSEPMSLTEIETLRSHIHRCWTPPIWIYGTGNPNVDVVATLDEDGNVLTADVENKKRMMSDRAFRVAAENAIRTMLKCSPLPLPRKKYPSWKTLIFTFDPSFLAR